MNTKPKADWKEIDLRGHRAAYVAIVNGREVGTIAKVKMNSAWSISNPGAPTCAEVRDILQPDWAPWFAQSLAEHDAE